MEPALQAKLDGFLDEVFLALQKHQTAYFTGEQRGSYWQGLHLCSMTPEDGATMAPDAADQRPTNETVAWADLGILPALVPCCCWVDTYAGPQGPGWVLSAAVMVKGVRWMRMRQVGPERWREHDWQAMPD